MSFFLSSPLYPFDLTMNQRSKREHDQAKRLNDLLTRTGYTVVQKHNQRIFEPPISINTPEPNNGSEVFVGRLPRSILEDELVPIFETIGPIYRVRLMMEFPGKNRGYAFITYKKPFYADLAVKNLNNFKLCDTYALHVQKSIENCRLFIRDLPREKTRREITKKLKEHVTGIMEVIVHSSNVPGEVNRGYVFVDFVDQRSAAVARRKLGSGMRVTLWKSSFPIMVDWAEPVPPVNKVTMNQVTELYVRNVKLELNAQELQVYIGQYVSLATVVKVRKIYDYAFLHFKTHKSAEYAFKRLQGLMIEGHSLEVSWAHQNYYKGNLPVQSSNTSVFTMTGQPGDVKNDENQNYENFVQQFQQQQINCCKNV